MAATPDVALQSRAIDDKSPICIPFILERLKLHRASDSTKPFIIGLNGVQGVGKTTLVKALAETLEDREGLKTLVVSIDDFYLRHADQLALAAAHPDNALVQNRGEPGELGFLGPQILSHSRRRYMYIYIERERREIKGNPPPF